MQNEKMIGDYEATEQEIEEQNVIAEYIFGMVARRDGDPVDRTKSLLWQRGWSEAGSRLPKRVRTGIMHRVLHGGVAMVRPRNSIP
jgi:hypothetical protein